MAYELVTCDDCGVRVGEECAIPMGKDYPDTEWLCILCYEELGHKNEAQANAST